MGVAVGGYDWDIVNTSLNGSGYTEVTYPRPVRAFFHRSRNDRVLLMKRDSADSAFLTIIPGDKPSAEVTLSNSSASQASLGYLNTQDGSSDVVETVVII